MGVTGDNFMAYLWHWVIHHASVVVRTECLDAVGGLDTSLRVAEDADLYLRLTARYDAIYLPEPLVLIREHPGQKSVANWQAQRTHHALTRILRKLLDDLPRHREPLRPSVQRRLVEYQLLGVPTHHTSWESFGSELVVASRSLSDLPPFHVIPHLISRRIADWIAQHSEPAREDIELLIVGAAEPLQEHMPAHAMQGRIFASFGLQMLRSGRDAGVWLRKALAISPAAAVTQIGWAIPGALRGLVWQPGDR